MLFLLILVLIFVLILILLILLIVFLIFLVVLVLTTTLVLLLLILLLFLMFTEHEVITGLIIVRVQTEGVLIGLDSLTVHLMRLTDDTDVMEGLSLAQGIGLQTRSGFELFNGNRVFLLSHQSIAEVERCLRILGVLLNGLTVSHLRIGIVATMEEFVALTNILTVALGCG